MVRSTSSLDRSRRVDLDKPTSRRSQNWPSQRTRMRVAKLRARLGHSRHASGQGGLHEEQVVGLLEKCFRRIVGSDGNRNYVLAVIVVLRFRKCCIGEL